MHITVTGYEADGTCSMTQKSGETLLIECEEMKIPAGTPIATAKLIELIRFRNAAETVSGNGKGRSALSEPAKPR